ncbi:MAG: hypothetical protein MZV64_16950 [Ignavibacteriales bacterium]|nr:hypothetical protein [Ignavibacteriales bacterium]
MNAASSPFPPWSALRRDPGPAAPVDAHRYRWDAGRRATSRRPSPVARGTCTARPGGPVAAPLADAAARALLGQRLRPGSRVHPDHRPGNTAHPLRGDRRAAGHAGPGPGADPGAGGERADPDGVAASSPFSPKGSTALATSEGDGTDGGAPACTMQAFPSDPGRAAGASAAPVRGPTGPPP